MPVEWKPLALVLLSLAGLLAIVSMPLLYWLTLKFDED